MQDGSEHYALGQITEIKLRNIWSEDPTMRGLIRQKGRVDPITGRQDVHTATLLVSSVFGKQSNVLAPSILGTVPPTGTIVKLVNEEIMNDLIEAYANEIFYLGRVYGSNVLLPMWFKHFGSDKGGLGEAYHIGIFGKTGSGKSVLSKMIMLGYARHKQMTIFVLDPQGEFAKLKVDKSIKEIIERNLSKEFKIIDLHNLVLSGYELFKKILIMSGFFEKLGIFADDNKARAADQIERILRGKVKESGIAKEVKPWDFYKKDIFNLVWGALSNDSVLNHIYSTKDPKERVKTALTTLEEDEMYRLWAKVANLFKYKDGEGFIIKGLTKSVTAEAKGQIIIIDLSETSVPDNILWNDNIRMIVINEFLKSLSEAAQDAYKQGKTLNTLVILDEAHRLAPREKPENIELEKVKNTLKDAVRTTRKYGLGWMFVSQTIYSLDKEIINQLRIYVFGYGLAYGVELQALREIIGGNEESIRLYQSFKDPQSTLQKEYSFMTVGPVSPLAFSGIPLFFQVLQYPDEFVRINYVT